MALSQQKMREIVLQILYSVEVGFPPEALMIELIMNELAVTKKNVRLAYERALQINKLLSEIDPLISSASTSYEFIRIQTVTKNILRLGVYEIFYDDQIPPRVAIAEAIRLSRKFNSPESALFVNALLDHLYQASLGKAVEDNHELSEQAQLLIKSEEIASEKALQDDLKNRENFSDDDDE